ncbi:MAG: hypothetical protein K8R90_02310 [Candidatus Cloacimonetes bacterium]|nr:hypothetical protein [Candidatus Cloacimonadota bacterium]
MGKSKYNAEFHPQLARWIVSSGYSDRKLATEFDVRYDTIKRWKKRHEAFATAIREASKLHDENVEGRLLKSALGSDEPELVERVELASPNQEVSVRTKFAVVQPSLAAQKFWLQHRRPDRWREQPDDDEQVYDEVEFLT